MQSQKIRMSAVRRLACIGAMATGVMVAEGASAAQLVMTFTGTATSIADPTNMLGLAPGVTSAAFVDTFTFDLSTPGAFTTPTQVFGGSNFGIPSPLVGSKLTINGHTVDFLGGHGDQAYYGPLSSGPGVEAFLGPGFTGPYYFNHVVLTTALATTLDVPFSASGTGLGSFQICPSAASCSTVSQLLAGDFSPATYVAKISSPALEPATWALSVLGLGVAGAAMRRARRPGGAVAAA